MTTMTKEETLNAALFATLRALTGLSICERNRDVPVDAYPAVVYRDGEAVPDYNQEVATIWFTSEPVIELFVEADEPGELPAKMDALYQKVVAAALTDHTVGGVAEDLMEVGNEPVLLDAEGAKPTLGRAVRLHARWTTGIATRT